MKINKLPINFFGILSKDLTFTSVNHVLLYVYNSGNYNKVINIEIK